MIENYSIDEILNAMEDLQNIDNNKKDKIFRKNLDNNIPKHTLKIIEEELGELKDAISKKDLKETIDALTDILYVTYGAGHAFGVDLDKCFEEVQNSNMSKLGEDGKPIYNENGKVMKGPNYFKPNLNQFLK